MFISHKYKLIFIHIQKTGGTSIEQLIEDSDPDLVKSIQIEPSKKTLRHAPLSEIKNAMDGAVFNNYKKVCVVRNPFDRMVSWYAMFKHGSHEIDPLSQPSGFKEMGDRVLDEVKRHVGSFEDFIFLPREHQSGLFERFYMNQLDYISDKGAVLADTVIKFESLNSDFKRLAEEIGLNGSLPHVNRSIREKNYRSCYTEKTKEALFERFRKDFEYFQYEF